MDNAPWFAVATANDSPDRTTNSTIAASLTAGEWRISQSVKDKGVGGFVGASPMLPPTA
jgi:hypothetical protein